MLGTLLENRVPILTAMELAQGGMDATPEQVLDFARRTLTDR